MTRPRKIERVGDEGGRYAFSIDGGPPRPDPRSPSQPDGIDGFSEAVDHGAFAWTDAGWRGFDLSTAVLYELHLGTFSAGGTFDAAIEKLPHLVSLGVDAVELMPVAEFPGDRGWGYDGVDLFAPHHAYGGPDGLKRFVDAAHAAGIGVVMDVVYNHLGPAGNYLGEFGPFFTDRYETPWGMAVNFDGPGSGEVRRFFLDNAAMWMRDYHCDGLRLDAVHAIFDRSPMHILEELATERDALSADVGRPLVLIAETDVVDPRLLTTYGLDGQWFDDFHHALHTILTGERDGYYESFGTIAQLADAMRGKPHAAPWRFVSCAQNHDQIGNRARGDRTSHLLSTEQLRVAAALLLLSPLTPMLFMGEEWGASTPFQYFTGHPDAALGRSVSEGRRREFAAFGWAPDDVPDPQDPATFARSKLRWDEVAREPHASLLAWHRELISLRRSLPPVSSADDVKVVFDESERWLVLERPGLRLEADFGRAQLRIRS